MPLESWGAEVAAKLKLEKETQYVAVDPGMSGAVARSWGGTIEYWGGFKRREDIFEATRRARLLVPAGAPTVAIVERVGARPGQGVSSMFSFGRAYGWAEAALYDQFKDVHYVVPVVWKGWFRRELAVPRGQDVESPPIARAIFGGHFRGPKGAEDHNAADAALLTVWYRLGRKV